MNYIIYQKDLKKIFDEPQNFLILGKEDDNQTCIEALLESISENAPDEVEFVLIDTRNSFKKYENDPHLFLPRITDAHEGLKTLEFLVSEMEKHYQMLSENHVRNIVEYNQKADPSSKMPFIYIIIDDLKDIVAFDDECSWEPIVRIAQEGKCCGFRVFVAIRNTKTKRKHQERIIRSNMDIAIVTPDFEDEDDLNTLKRIAYLEDDIYVVVANQKDLEIVQEKLGIDRFSTKWSILSFHEEAGKSDE